MIPISFVDELQKIAMIELGDLEPFAPSDKKLAPYIKEVEKEGLHQRGAGAKAQLTGMGLGSLVGTIGGGVAGARLAKSTFGGDPAFPIAGAIAGGIGGMFGGDKIVELANRAKNKLRSKKMTTLHKRHEAIKNYAFEHGGRLERLVADAGGFEEYE